MEILLEELSEIKKSISETNTQISEATITLQTILKEKEKQLKDKKKEIAQYIAIFTADKNNHVIERFKNWCMYADKAVSDWIIDNGAMRNEFCDWWARYQTIDLVDTLIDWVSDNIDCDVLGYDKAVEKFDSLKDSAQSKITVVIEDAIKQNVKSFTYDW